MNAYGTGWDYGEFHQELRFRLWNFKRGADVLLTLEMIYMGIRR